MSTKILTTNNINDIYNLLKNGISISDFDVASGMLSELTIKVVNNYSNGTETSNANPSLTMTLSPIIKGKGELTLTFNYVDKLKGVDGQQGDQGNAGVAVKGDDGPTGECSYYYNNIYLNTSTNTLVINTTNI